MVWRELSAEDLYGLRNPLIIDVRSPCEFEEERIPEAVNIPLLSNDERALIGTIYKEDGEQSARRQAVGLISPKIPEIIERVLELKEHSQSIVVHCWRGGLRSEAVASVLSIAGVASYRLTGGYKAWRAMVLKDLVQDRFSFEPVVLYGLTGAGKTELLQALSLSGCQVLDLEALANHRGSAFGGLGKAPQPTQKNFEALLWNTMRKFDLSQPVFIEAESRKVGRLSLPDPILAKIRKGKAVLVDASVEARVKRIAEDYLSSSASPEVALDDSLQMLATIYERLGKAFSEEIAELLRKGEIALAVRILLIEYYDPLYGKSIRNKEFALTVASDDLHLTAEDLKQWLTNQANQKAGLLL